MSSNNTTTTEGALQVDLLIKFSAYITLGFTLMVTNLLIVGVILRFEVLRSKKEYIILAGKIRKS